MNETNHPSSLATCTLIQDFLGVKGGGIYEAVVKQKQQMDAVVADNSRLLPKAASELSNAWMLHKYWVGINAALMHLEMGRVAVAREWLIGTIAGPGIERPELKEVDDIDAWAEHQNRDSIGHARALEIIKAETPTTTAALAEVETRGVEKLADAWDAETAKIMEGPFFYGQIERREAFSKYVRGYLVELREAR